MRSALVCALLIAFGLSGTAVADEVATKAACTAEKSPKIKEIKDRGVLRWAVGIAAPFAAKDAKGEYVGTEPENASQFAKMLGVDLEIRDYSYDLLPPTVATGNADIVGAALYITDKRRQVIDFSEPYQREGQVFVVLQSRQDLNIIEDLNKTEIRVVNNIGSGQVDLSKKLLPKATHAAADLKDPSIQANFLISAQADTLMTDGASFPLLAKAAGGGKLKMIGPKGPIMADVPPGDETIEPFDIGFGIAKGDVGFLACVNGFVADLNQSGEFRNRYVAWVKKMAQ